MKKNGFLSLLLIAGISMIIISCSKEGPAGPAGATGPAGPVGPAGPQGTTNVTYSAWYTTVNADWVTTGVDPYKAAFLVNKSAPAITQAIIDNGLVLGYVTNWQIADTTGAPIGRSTDVAGMPYLADIGFLDYYDFVIPSAGKIRYLYKSYAPWSSTELTGTKFRYIVIPGSVSGGRGVNGSPTYEGHTGDELKAMTYEQVAGLFNIPAEGTNIH